MKMLLGLFTFEHFVMCAPMFILHYKINERNQYLDTMYGQLIEEQVLYKPLSVITLGQNRSDNINQMRTVTGDFNLVMFSKSDVKM